MRRPSLGDEPAPERRPEWIVRVWPVPVPQWFWSWARWYLGRDEFGRRAAESGRQAAPEPLLASPDAYVFVDLDRQILVAVRRGR